MPDTVPPWLEVARKYLGTEEVGGAGDNPTILKFVSNVSAAFPEQAEYAGNYKHDDTAWCGVFAADCFAECGIRPPFDKSDDEGSWMFANAWQRWGKQSTARIGCVLCFDHHVGFLNRIIDADTFEVLGGNQSSPQGGAVTLSRRRRSDVQSIRWPDETAVAVDAPPEIEFGATGQYVTALQALLRIPVTNVFDRATEAAVREFQRLHGLEVDGIVGEETWPALLAAAGQAPPIKGALPQEAIDRIVALAGTSELARYSWADRGVAPRGYIKGMAVTFAYVYAKWKAGDPAALVMTRPVGEGDEHDALAWYEAEFHAAGLGAALAPAYVLRYLFVLAIGLGMRESSGRYCEGRDQSASNTSADTAEAGLFQQSWNSHSASSQILQVMTSYLAKPDDGFFSIFKEGVTPQLGELANFGTGDGEVFQRLCKTRPAFAVEAAAIGLRVLRQHWGPINRHEAEVRPEADRLLAQVQAIVDALPIDGEILPPIAHDDTMLILIFFVLSEEKNMDANFRAQLLAEVREILKEGGAAIEHEPPKPALKPAPVQQPPAGFDINRFMPFLQIPLVQQFVSGKPVTIAEFLPLLPTFMAVFRGDAARLPPLITGPAGTPLVTPPPVQVPPVVVTETPAKTINWSTGVLAALGSIVASATGVMGTPVGPDATLTGLLVPALTIGASMLGIPAPIVSIFTNLFSNMKANAKPK